MVYGVIFILVAATMVVEINLIGRLLLAEVVLAGILPFTIIFSGPKNSWRIGPLAKHFYYFVGLWFLGAVITDVIQNTPPDNIARGWSKIIFFTINFTAIIFLVKGKIRSVIFLVFMIFVASAVRLRLDIDQSGIGGDTFGAAWKFGYGHLLTVATFLLASRLVSNPLTRSVGLCLPFIDALLNIALNARNLFGLSALAGLALALTTVRRRPLSPARIGMVGLTAVFAGWAMVSAYGYAASSGLMGLEAQEKYEKQSAGNLGILLGGRTESLASTQAIIDSPIIGHGSWARDIRYVEIMVSRLEQAGYEISGDPFTDDLIPSHSHLLGAWVEAGILGALFWIWAGWVTVRGLYASLASPTPYTGFVVFVALSFLWDIMFSPFGLEGRVMTPALLVLMMLVIEADKSKHLEGGKP